MKSRQFTSPDHHSFVKLLEAAAGYSSGVDRFRLFSDWLEMAFISLRQAVHSFQHGRINPEWEDTYLAIVGRYKNPEEFAEAMAVLVNALEGRRYDFLGSVAGEWELLDGEWRGQFFTPTHVCNLLSEISLGESKPDSKNRIAINEPACGAGATMIAAHESLRKRGFSPRDYWMDAADLDRRMFHACYIQLTLCGVPAVVRNMNTLSMEQYDAEITIVGAMHPWRGKPGTPKRPARRNWKEIQERVKREAV